MYQLGTKWQIWDLPTNFEDDVDKITIRGYQKNPPVSLPSDFYATKGLKPLSVEKIASAYCPLRRDLYLESKIGIESKKKVWGQIAGHLIESYFKGILVYFSDFAKEPKELTYQRINDLTQTYSQTFWQSRGKAKALKDLQTKADSYLDDPKRLVFLLQQTAKYELLMLGIDYVLSLNASEFIPLSERICLECDEQTLLIHPSPTLGLSKETTPDFLIRDPVLVMGDIKTGNYLKPFHLHTIAGFALAYESQYEINVDFGIVYFFETHSQQMNFAQSYVFLIDDFLRRKFLDERNHVYSLLQRKLPRITVKFRDKYYETHCSKCRFLDTCYPHE
jgi:CRISPR/Cas system-associated exonuclease Cas4 (RecB family)